MGNDQNGLHKVELIPAIRSKRNPLTFTNHHQNDDGTIGARVTEEEATHFLCHHFWIEEVTHDRS